jgi:hypothetical protein
MKETIGLLFAGSLLFLTPAVRAAQKSASDECSLCEAFGRKEGRDEKKGSVANAITTPRVSA